MDRSCKKRRKDPAMCRIAKEKAGSGIAMHRSRRTVATIVLAGALAAGCALSLIHIYYMKRR